MSLTKLQLLTEQPIMTEWIVNIRNSFHAQIGMIAEHFYHAPRKISSV
ncbi:hypothetical protein NP439_05055 [Oceanobacillus jeddahense]|uniref:Uncharacterized protein n=1 Tax=Oceanobacillus jeddahense TaxID=1462527 RepID=A0ABY5JW82_9BACI|nr:hypothetical protein [Oceanobacillus jeddahense]UUI04060.1 hypothetical protein NP439_05055 [Oceanobacillus jeddahense]